MQNRKRDTDVQNRLLYSMGEGEGGMIWDNNIETCISSSVKQITSSDWMHETGAQGWCTGMTQRDGGREVGGGFRMGNTVNPWLIHVSVWQKPLQYCKVISLQLIKIIGKNKNKTDNHQRPIVCHTDLWLMLWTRLDGLGEGVVWGRMDTLTCMVQSLCCSPESTTILLIGYAPI